MKWLEAQTEECAHKLNYLVQVQTAIYVPGSECSNLTVNAFHVSFNYLYKVTDTIHML